MLIYVQVFCAWDIWWPIIYKVEEGFSSACHGSLGKLFFFSFVGISICCDQNQLLNIGSILLWNFCLYWNGKLLSQVRSHSFGFYICFNITHTCSTGFQGTSDPYVIMELDGQVVKSNVKWGYVSYSHSLYLAVPLVSLAFLWWC